MCRRIIRQIFSVLDSSYFTGLMGECFKISQVAMKPNKKSYKCFICPYSTNIPYHDKIHQQSHISEKQFKCTLCQKSFARKQSVNYHKCPLESKSEDEEKIICTMCGETVTGNSVFRVHWTRHRQHKILYECDLCTYSTTQQEALSRHVNSHTQEKLFQCNECGKAFSCDITLKDHAYEHSTETRFVCDVCGKAFKKPSSLKIHKTIHVEKTFQCKHCEYICRNVFMLRKHMITHTKEKPEKCSLCGSRFSQPVSLKRHMQDIHSKENSYHCKFCGQNFSKSYYYIKHKKEHSDK